MVKREKIEELVNSKTLFHISPQNTYIGVFLNYPINESFSKKFFAFFFFQRGHGAFITKQAF